MSSALAHDRWVSEQEQRVLDALWLLMTDGQEYAYLIVSAGDYYFQCKKLIEEDTLWCEAASNYYLRKRSHIGVAAQARLVAFGFQAPEGDFHNFHWLGSLADTWQALDPLSAMVVSIMRDVYGVRPNIDLNIELCLEGSGLLD